MKTTSLTTYNQDLQFNEKKASGYAMLTVLCWSTVATAFKIGLKNQLPEQLIFIASITTVLILFTVLLFMGKLSLFKNVNHKEIGIAAILGFLNPFLYYIILFKTYSLLPAQVAQPINMIWPIVLVLLSIPILKQKLKAKHIVALFISFGGIYLITTQGSITSHSQSDPVGIMLGIGSAFIWASYWLLNVKIRGDKLFNLFLTFLFGTVYLIIYLLAFSSIKIQINESFYAGIYIGFFEIGFSFIFWMKALSLTKHNAKIANLVYIVPFVSLIFIHLILKEEIYYTTIFGIVFVIAGILYQQTSLKLRK